MCDLVSAGAALVGGIYANKQQKKMEKAIAKSNAQVTAAIEQANAATAAAASPASVPTPAAPTVASTGQLNPAIAGTPGRGRSSLRIDMGTSGKSANSLAIPL